MARFSNSNRLGIALESATTTPQVPVGTVVSGYDNVSDSEGEYVCVRAGAALTEGQIACIDHTQAQATLASSTNQANDGVSLGFALGAVAAGEYCFLQISGKVKAKSAAAVAGAKVFLSATAGTVDDAVIAGSQVIGAQYSTADGTPAAGFAYVTANRPSAQTQIT